ncbi:MAG: hypothetical protein ACI90M_004240, partial [Candidatus Azotimanducaceae bacterium]
MPAEFRRRLLLFTFAGCVDNGLRELAFEPVPGFTPLPRKLVTVMAGACCEDVNFWVLLSAS